MSTEEIAAWFETHGMERPADDRVQVSVYAVSRGYGGPEEGGWYYDTYDFAGVSERVPIDEIDAAKTRLSDLFADQQPRYPLSSVLSNGPEYRVFTEEKAAELQSTPGRPHYQ